LGVGGLFTNLALIEEPLFAQLDADVDECRIQPSLKACRCGLCADAAVGFQVVHLINFTDR
jgi:hypothetical protein